MGKRSCDCKGRCQCDGAVVLTFGSGAVRVVCRPAGLPVPKFEPNPRPTPGPAGGYSTTKCQVLSNIPKGCSPAGCFCGFKREICTTFSYGGPNGGGANTDYKDTTDCAF